MRRVSADVAIIGGGIIGLSTALFLQRLGRRAVVLERWLIGSEASGRNGGGVCQQGRVLPEIAIARGAADLWSRLDDLLGRPTGYRRTGNLFVAESEAELEMLAAARAAELRLGLDSELLGREAVRELAPGLGAQFIGGKLCPSDGHAIPAQATVAIGEAAREAGAEILCHQRVERVGVHGGRVEYVESADVRVEAPIVLNAAGPWAPSVAQLVDGYLPIFPARALAMLTPPVEYQAGPFVITADWEFSACQWADGRIYLGGGAERGDLDRFTFRKGLPDGPVESVTRRAANVFPALAGVALDGAWAGTRECTPDMMPIIDRLVEPEGFFVCAGFSGHGFCLGPYAGQLMAEWLALGQPSLDLDPFSLRRFQRPEGPLAVPSGGTPPIG